MELWYIYSETDGWYWKKDDGNWQRYKKDAGISSKTIEKYYKCHPDSKIEFRIGENRYAINLKALIQKNYVTGKCRPVQRVSNGVSTVGKVEPPAPSNPVNAMTLPRPSSGHLSRTSPGQSLATYQRTTFSSLPDKNAHAIELEKRERQAIIQRFRSFRSPSEMERKERGQSLNQRTQTLGSKPTQQQPSSRITWDWQDDNGMWLEYDGSASSDKLERAFANNPNAEEVFEARGQIYSVVFSRMEQVNVMTGKTRRVRRVAPQVAQVTSVTQATQQNIYPRTWIDCDDSLRLVPVIETTQEYREVADLFVKTMPNDPIKSVERVQNRLLYQRFHVCKTQLESRLGQGNGMRQLFHGTCQSNIQSICKQGFDCRLHSMHLYGNGSYFACKASYSHGYTDCRKMFLAQVNVLHSD